MTSPRSTGGSRRAAWITGVLTACVLVACNDGEGDAADTEATRGKSPETPEASAAAGPPPVLGAPAGGGSAEGRVAPGERGASAGSAPARERAETFPAQGIQARCAVPGEPSDGTIRIERGLRYGGPAARAMQLDLARPTDGGAHPAVILVHGGGWRTGERSHMDREMRVLAGQGYVSASIDYRLAHPRRDAFPEAVGDVRCAVKWMRTHGQRHGADPDRIALVGMSAGGHLAALAALAPERRELDDECPHGEASPRVQAVVAYFAPLDLLAQEDFPGGKERVIARFLGARPSDDPERARLASPISHAGADDPPVLLVHGSVDSTVPPSQSRRMREVLAGSGNHVVYVEVPGAGHGFPLLARRPQLRNATCTTLAFLSHYLHR